MRNKELAATGVWSGMRHAQRSWAVSFRVGCAQFTFYFVPWATGARLASSAFATIWATALDHKITDNAVESEFVVKACFGQFYEIFDRLGSRFVEQSNGDIAMGSMENGFRHKGSVKKRG